MRLLSIFFLVMGLGNRSAQFTWSVIWPADAQRRCRLLPQSAVMVLLAVIYRLVGPRGPWSAGWGCADGN